MCSTFVVTQLASAAAYGARTRCPKHMRVGFTHQAQAAEVRAAGQVPWLCRCPAQTAPGPAPGSHLADHLDAPVEEMRSWTVPS